jgi:FixJ family two-component response regulator
MPPEKPKTPPNHKPCLPDEPHGIPNSPLHADGVGNVAAEPRVLLLTDDPQAQKQVKDALHATGYRLQVLAEPADLWAMGFPPAPTCLLCSHPLRNGITGFDVLEGIRERAFPIPTLFMAADWNVDLVVQAMKAGAIDFLTLPLDSNRLGGAVEQALQEARPRWKQARAVAAAKARVTSLDKREHQVIRLVINGFLNKEIADNLNLALVTIKLYRSRAMKKMGAGNAPEMVRIATLAGMCNEESIPRPH